jgi:O-glycosyl hydrolase
MLELNKYLIGNIMRKSIVLFIIFLAVWVGIAQADTYIIVNATKTYQTMDGIGSNINTWSWKNGELRPALDALIDKLGHNKFRVIHDRMEWAGIGSIRPSTTLTNLQNLDPATLQSVYEVSDMQDLWNTIAYMNDKGVTGDQIMINFMGWTAPWMGGSGDYGTASYITNNAQTNQDIATMIASLVYYGHHRRDISGSNQNLSFGYVSPFNEPDLNGLEGPLISPAQMNTIYENIVSTLTSMGDTTTKIVGPDTIGYSNTYTATFSPAVLARMSHISFHAYGDSTYTQQDRDNVLADWMTETSKWCSGCDYNEPLSESEWSFGSDTADILMEDIQNGFSAVLTWEGFDTFYYHHNSFSAWGHVGCRQNGAACVISDTYPRVYTVRGRAWPEGTLARAIRPGMTRIGTSTNLFGIVSAFYDSSTGWFSIVGHNSGSSSITINGQLQNLPAISSLSLYQTNSSFNLQHTNDVTVNGGLFTATIPADTFFYFININEFVLPGKEYANGTVIDTVTKKGIANAVVTTNTSVLTTTNGTGFYSLNLIKGAYKLSVNKDPEYYQNSSVVVMVTGDWITAQDIQLVRKPEGIISGTCFYQQ